MKGLVAQYGTPPRPPERMIKPAHKPAGERLGRTEQAEGRAEEGNLLALKHVAERDDGLCIARDDEFSGKKGGITIDASFEQGDERGE